MIEPSAASVGLKLATPVISKAITSTLDAIRSVGGQLSEKTARQFRLGFSDFLETSFNRCQQVKTIVTGDAPVPLLDVYENLNLELDDSVFNDIDIIDELEDYRRIVITGTGGAGKSMLMKYLTLSRFENCKGKIPLFIELRNLNNITSKDLLSYFFASCSTASNKVTFASFSSVFSSGGFLLILDGFDEIDSQYKDDISSQILELGRKFPKAIIVVSSRNDPRFKGWQDYYVFELSKLNQNQVKSLISKVKYDKGIKRRFLRDLPALWNTHSTFLSIPLLSVIMLLTFGKFAEISPKATLFYKLAFQTLFREHDANKEQFKRDLHTSLDLDDFERAFSAFCALSYLENKFSFEHRNALKFAKNSMAYARLSAEPDLFICDLVENVCMLQQEGTELTFVHRSFQEYFCAFFLASYHESNEFEVISNIARRENDSTLNMYREIDESKFEINWLCPILDRFIDQISSRIASKSPSYALQFFTDRALYNRDDKMVGLHIADPETMSILENIRKIYPQCKKLSFHNIYNLLRGINLQEACLNAGIPESEFAKIFMKRHSGEFDEEAGQKELEFNAAADRWLDHTSVMSEINAILKSLKALRTDIAKKRQDQSAIIIL